MNYAFPINGYTSEAKQLQLSDQAFLHYLSMGHTDHPPMVFVHGLGNNATVWLKMMDLLRSDFHSIAIDLPGHGRSSTDEGVSIRNMAEVVIKLVDQLGLEKVTLVGHSMGGQISAKAALFYPEKFQRLVLLAPAGFEVFTPKQKAWLKSIYATWLLKKLSLERMLEQFRENFFRVPPNTGFFMEDLKSLRSDPTAFDHYCRMLSACMSAMLDEPIFEDLPALKLPTLVIYGENDALIPNPVLHPDLTLPEVAEGGAARISDVALEMMPECGHMLQWEKAKALSQLIKTFSAA